jgi:hypothetical protein
MLSTAMTKKRTGKKTKPPTGNADANAAERQALAVQSANEVLAKNVLAACDDAILLIERMLCELYMIYAWLEDSGFDSNQFVVVTAAFQQIKYFLTEVGPLATISAVEALHRFWLHDKAFPEGLSHEQYFTAAGLGALAKECFRTMQDAIAMSTIFYPEVYQQILDMGLCLSLMSRLSHSHHIMKRYLRCMAEHLLLLSEAPPTVVTKRITRTAEFNELKAEIRKAAADNLGHSGRCQSAGSSTDTVLDAAASLKSRSMSAGRQLPQHWLDTATAALSRSREPKP